MLFTGTKAIHNIVFQLPTVRNGLSFCFSTGDSTQERTTTELLPPSYISTLFRHFNSESESHLVAQAGLTPSIFLPQPCKGCDYRSVCYLHFGLTVYTTSPCLLDSADAFFTWSLGLTLSRGTVVETFPLPCGALGNNCTRALVLPSLFFDFSHTFGSAHFMGPLPFTS